MSKYFSLKQLGEIKKTNALARAFQKLDFSEYHLRSPAGGTPNHVKPFVSRIFLLISRKLVPKVKLFTKFSFGWPIWEVPEGWWSTPNYVKIFVSKISTVTKTLAPKVRLFQNLIFGNLFGGSPEAWYPPNYVKIFVS